MSSSQVPCSTRRGVNGYIETQVFGYGTSRVSELTSKTPLRLLSPNPQPEERAVLVFVLNHGGGLVAGDSISLQVNVCPGSRLGLLTQGNTKVYRSASRSTGCAQTLNAVVGTGAAMLILPDPIQPFRDSSYRQEQIFEIDSTTSSLLILDWVCEGRTARSEKWDFTEWKGRNEIWSAPSHVEGGEVGESGLLLRDNTTLKQSSRLTPSLRERMDEFGVFGSLFIRWPLFKELAASFMEAYARLPRVGAYVWSTHGTTQAHNSQKANTSGSSETNVKWTVTSARGSVVVRFAAQAVEPAKQWLREVLIADGTVEREFGKRYLFTFQ